MPFKQDIFPSTPMSMKIKHFIESIKFENNEENEYYKERIAKFVNSGYIGRHDFVKILYNYIKCNNLYKDPTFIEYNKKHMVFDDTLRKLFMVTKDDPELLFTTVQTYVHRLFSPKTTDISVKMYEFINTCVTKDKFSQKIKKKFDIKTILSSQIIERSEVEGILAQYITDHSIFVVKDDGTYVISNNNSDEEFDALFSSVEHKKKYTDKDNTISLLVNNLYKNIRFMQFYDSDDEDNISKSSDNSNSDSEFTKDSDSDDEDEDSDSDDDDGETIKKTIFIDTNEDYEQNVIMPKNINKYTITFVRLEQKPDTVVIKPNIKIQNNMTCMCRFNRVILFTVSIFMIIIGSILILEGVTLCLNGHCFDDYNIDSVMVILYKKLNF